MEQQGKEKKADELAERLSGENGDRAQTSYSLPFAVPCVFLVGG
jgi:hypothetical protein